MERNQFGNTTYEINLLSQTALYQLVRPTGLVNLKWLST